MKTKVTFTLPAEAVQGATEAILLGDFNNWNPEQALRLEKQKDGSYKTVAQLESGHTYQYRFLLDNNRWVNDYHAQGYLNIPGFSVDNCVITVPEPVAEETKKVQPANVKKSVKAEPVIKQASEVSEPVTAKTNKKETSKSIAPKAVKAKAVGEKAEKPVKAAKKASPKAKK